MNSEACTAASGIRVQSVRKVLLGMGQRTRLATQPLGLRISKRKGASARPGLEPEPCGCERRAQVRAPQLLISSMSKFL